MDSTPALRASGLFLVASACMVMGCTPHTSGSSGSNESQCRVDTDVLCPGNYVGYSCQAQTKPSPACSSGTLEFDGEVGYCCPVQSSQTCDTDSTVDCVEGAIGYSCTAGRPSDIDSSLVCSTATAGTHSALLYCCTPS